MARMKTPMGEAEPVATDSGGMRVRGAAPAGRAFAVHAPRVPVYVRYLLARTLRMFAATFLMVLMALLLERLVRLLDLFVNYATPPMTLLLMLANLVPHYIGIGLPAAFFVAVLSVFLSLRRESELYTLEAAGLSPWQLIKPILGLAAVLTAAALLVTAIIGPNARYGYRSLVFSVKNSSIQAVLEQHRTFTTIDGRTLYVEHWPDDGAEPQGLILHEERSDGFSTFSARSGRFVSDESGMELYLELHDGDWLSTSARGGSPSLVEFDSLRLPLKRGATQLFRARGSDVRELTLSELWSLRRAGSPNTAAPDLIFPNPSSPNLAGDVRGGDVRGGFTAAQVEAELHGRLARVFSILFLPLLAGALTRSAPRASGRPMAIGGALFLIGFNYVLQLGGNIAETGRASVMLAIWGPTFGFAALSTAAFAFTGTRIAETVEFDPGRWLRRTLRRLGLERSP